MLTSSIPQFSLYFPSEAHALSTWSRDSSRLHPQESLKALFCRSLLAWTATVKRLGTGSTLDDSELFIGSDSSGTDTDARDSGDFVLNESVDEYARAASNEVLSIEEGLRAYMRRAQARRSRALANGSMYDSQNDILTIGVIRENLLNTRVRINVVLRCMTGIQIKTP